MKLISKRLLIVAAAACVAWSGTTQTCHAGPWLDSLFGGRSPVYPVGVPIPVNRQIAAYSPGGYQPLGYVPPSYANLRSPQVLGYGSYASPPTNNAPLIAPGFPQPVFGQLPTAAYDSQWARTPVTYYRPVTAFDPRYGTTVTSLQPCTSYQYQALRQPVIAPRPLLGEYGLQANRWPSITGPGYNPTGLANPAMVAPVAQPYQYIPNVGTPIISQTSSLAPTMGAVGVSSGMPASTLPLNSMSYNSAYVGQQAIGQQYPVQQSYYNGQNYNGQVVVNPAYSSGLPSPPNVGWSNPTVGSGVIPSAAWMPSTPTCANGVCPQPTNSQPTSQVPTPYIPGATSVTPVGPPTYSSMPNPSYGPSNFAQPNNSSTGIGPGANATVTPGITNPYANPYANPNSAPSGNGQVFPSNQVFPPNSNLSDPESTRTPSLGMGSLGASSATPKASDKPFDVQTLPMVAIDRQSSSRSKEIPTSLSSPNSLLNTRDIPSRILNGTPEIPQTLAPRGNAVMQPLSAPDDFDSKPRWNPTLLDPDDRTVMERASRLTPNQSEADGSIRLVEDRDSTFLALAIETKKTNRNSIQLVSGVETKESKAVGSDVIRFRPVATLK